jgi:hypothetical protein
MKYKLDEIEFDLNIENVIEHEIHGITPEFHHVKYFNLDCFLKPGSIAGCVKFLGPSNIYPIKQQVVFYNFIEKQFDDCLIWNKWKIKNG